MAERRPRVLVLNHYAVPKGYAGGTRHVELFSRLHGWDYLIIAGDRNHQTGERQPAEPGFLPVRVSRYRSNGPSRIVNWISYAVMAFLKGLGAGRVDVVYGSSPHLLAGLAAWLLSVVKRATFVLEVRDLWPRVLVDMGRLSERSPRFQVLTALESFLYARASRIVVMADGTRSILVSRGVSDRKIAYIPNGADPQDFIPSASRNELRERYGFTRFTAVYAGAHGPANGLNLLLDAAAEVDGLGIDIVLVGGGVTKNALVREATSRELSNVCFMPPIPKSEIPDLLHAADVGLHVLADVELFRSAVSPNKVFDYMAAGLPVITNVPGLVTRIVSDSRSGIAVSPHALGSAFRKAVAEDPAALDGAGQLGQQWLRDNQSRQAMLARLARLMEEVL